MYWVSEYKKLGITFVPMPDPEVPNLQGKVGREMTRAYGVYEWLKHQQFDIVHASEWKGLSYYCLVAKNLGIAFPDTLFCIKASSPSLWNLEGNAQLLKNPGVLITAFIERKSIELADVVVSGSKYMLQWMMKHGYQLPSKHVYVQPNIILDAGLEKKANNNRGPYAVEEMVFFGRLEPRKPPPTLILRRDKPPQAEYKQALQSHIPGEACSCTWQFRSDRGAWKKLVIPMENY